MSEAQGQGQAAAQNDGTQAQVQDAPDLPDSNRTYSQAEYQSALNKVGSKEKKDGIKSGRSERESELLQEWAEFGVESLEDVKSTLQAQQEISAELEGEQIQNLKKQHKAELKAAQDELKAHADALSAILETQREGLPEHVIELLDEKSAPDQLAYIAKHGEVLRAEAKPPTVGRGSSPGGGGSQSASRADVTPGLGRLRVAYETR